MSPDSPDLQSNGLADAEPKAERATAPIALIILFALLVFWSMLYLDANGGGFNPKVYRTYGNYAELDAAQPVAGPEVEFPKRGKLIFERTCAACHQSSGIGSPANGCPPLVNSEWVNSPGPNRIISLVLNGGTGPISVLGQQYPGTTPMTPWKDTLKDDEIAYVLSYVRTAWGNKAGIVMPETVAKIRAKEKADGFTGYRNSADLLKLPDKD